MDLTVAVTDTTPAKRHISTMNKHGELILSDGSIVGHRDLRVYYRQKMPTTQSSRITRGLVSQYKRLGYGMATTAKETKEKRTAQLQQRRYHQQKIRLQVRSHKFNEHFRTSVSMN